MSGVLVMLGAGCALLIVGALSRAERLPRNRIAGMRTRATLQSDGQWLAAHRASAWSPLLAGALAMASGAYAAISDTDESVLSFTAIPIVLVAVAGGLQADRVAKRVGSQPRELSADDAQHLARGGGDDTPDLRTITGKIRRVRDLNDRS